MQDTEAIDGKPVEKLFLGRFTTRQVVMAFIAIQVLVPLLLLGVRWIREGTHPVNEYPLSWQMYSAVRSGEYIGIDADGNEINLSTEMLPAFERGEGYGDSVPLMLCDVNSELVSVHRENAHPSLNAESVRC
jgi:hypothetical protein